MGSFPGTYNDPNFVGSCVSGREKTVRSSFLQIPIFFLSSCAGQSSSSVISVSSVKC